MILKIPRWLSVAPSLSTNSATLGTSAHEGTCAFLLLSNSNLKTGSQGGVRLLIMNHMHLNSVGSVMHRSVLAVKMSGDRLVGIPHKTLTECIVSYRGSIFLTVPISAKAADGKGVSSRLNSHCFPSLSTDSLSNT